MRSQIMSHPEKSSDDLSSKVIAVRTADDSNFEFEFPASGPQSTPWGLTARSELPERRGLNLHAGVGGWQHGGINE
jgi:hypothetical protein